MNDQATIRWRTRTLIAWLHSPAFVESLAANVRGIETLCRPGVTFTPEQIAQIKALPPDDAQRVILDQLNAELDE